VTPPNLCPDCGEEIIDKAVATRPNGGDMSSQLTELIAKRLEEDGDAERTELVRKQLAAGTITVEKVAAELACESLARKLRERRPELSFEKAYSMVLRSPEHREIVAKLLD